MTGGRFEEDTRSRIALKGYTTFLSEVEANFEGGKILQAAQISLVGVDWDNVVMEYAPRVDRSVRITDLTNAE